MTEHNDEFRDRDDVPSGAEMLKDAGTAASRRPAAATPAAPASADTPTCKAASKPAGGAGRPPARRSKLPSDHPSDHLEPIRTNRRLGEKCLEVVRKSGIVPLLEEEMMARPGPKTVLRPKAAATVALMSGSQCRSLKSADVSRVLAGLDPHVARKLGLAGTQVPYRMVVRQMRTLRRTLLACLPDPDTGGIVDVVGAVNRLVASSIPESALPDIGACAVDRSELQVRSAAWHRRQTANGRPSADWVPELAATVVVAVPSARSGGTLPYILAVSVDEPFRSPGRIGLETVRRAMEIAPQISEVVAGPAFTVRPADFVRPLHASGIDVVMNHPRSAQGRVRAVAAGPGGNQTALSNCGTLFDTSLPKAAHVPPRCLSGAARAAWFDRRAEQFAYRPFCKVRGGDGLVSGIRFRRPAQTGAAAPGGPRTISIPIHLLDDHQANPYGTTDHAAAFGRLRAAEHLVGQMPRGPEVTGPKTWGADDLAARAIVAAAFAVDHNLRVAARAGQGQTGGNL